LVSRPAGAVLLEVAFWLDTDLGTFEALEFLVLGIHGKSALRRALSTIARFDPRLQKVDFDRLNTRAQSEPDEVDERR